LEISVCAAANSKKIMLLL